MYNNSTDVMLTVNESMCISICICMSRNYNNRVAKFQYLEHLYIKFIGDFSNDQDKIKIYVTNKCKNTEYPNHHVVYWHADLLVVVMY